MLIDEATGQNVRLVDAEQGVVSRAIFGDPEIYRLEQQRIFQKCWLCVGHESSVQAPGDYLSSFMGEDSVIVWRGSQGRIGVYVNTCTHRGNRLCLYDRGNARALSCSYHGWTFNNDGQVAGVPFLEQAYYGHFDRDKHALVKPAKVATYAGLIFACWDPESPSLDDYLGEMRWYLDKLFALEAFGGLEVLPGCQKYMMAGNWKLFCDNFASDSYHVPTTHASALRVGIARGGVEAARSQQKNGLFMGWAEPAHGIGHFYTGDVELEADLGVADQYGLGPEVKDYVRERHRVIREGMQDVPSKPNGWVHANCFPNLNTQGLNSALRGHLLILCHPRGPEGCEVWQWCLIEKQAPKAVKRLAARRASRGQAGSGIVGVDDAENFERIVANTRTRLTQSLTFDYSMGREVDGHWPGQEEWDAKGLPGIVAPEYWEGGHRRFYKFWAQMMGVE